MPRKQDTCPICGGLKNVGSRLCRQCRPAHRPDYAPVVRFWKKVDKSAGPDGCWLWTGSRRKAGYGYFSINGKRVMAHRFSYELHHGSLPEGLFALHKCDNPPCVNPAHLFAGTTLDNAQDSIRKGRAACGERSWARLHPELAGRAFREMPIEAHARGEQHGSAKLTWEQVREIRATFPTANMTITDFAAKYHISWTNMKSILVGRLWKE